MTRFCTIAMAMLLAILAACATPPPEAPPQAQPQPPRDLLVELGDAEAAGDREAMLSLAAEMMADPATDTALQQDLADLMAREGDTAGALAAYEQLANAEAAAPEPDWARLINLEARMAEIAVAAGDSATATGHAGRAVGLVADHLGVDHPRMAPLLAFAKANGLDLTAIAMAGGFATLEDMDLALADAIERSRDTGAALPAGRRLSPRVFGEEPDFDLVKVFYGTDRAADPGEMLVVDGEPVLDARTYYSAERGKLETGTVIVSVPRNRALGEIPKPSVLRFDVRPDPARHVIVGDMKIHPDMEAFVREVKLELAKSQRREIFVFIHGYNTKFDAGIERTAQLSTDLEIDGAAVFYSWPSAGSLFGYKADRSQITPDAVKDLEDFLLVLADKTAADRISVVAHSMGNEFLTLALEQMTEDRPGEKLFNEVIFASPDVDADEFIERVSAIDSLADDFTLYASSKDRALQASRRFNGTGRRAGDSVEPVLLPVLNTIDTSAVSDGGLGHSDIFGGAFTDFQAILWLSLEPDQRCLLGRREEGNAVAWVLGAPRTEFCGQQAFLTAMTTMRRVGVEESALVLSEQAAEAESIGSPDAPLWQSALRIVEWLGIAGRFMPETATSP
jgi:esterase/lipase superfamily enzyme